VEEKISRIREVQVRVQTQSRFNDLLMEVLKGLLDFKEAFDQNGEFSYGQLDAIESEI